MATTTSHVNQQCASVANGILLDKDKHKKDVNLPRMFPSGQEDKKKDNNIKFEIFEKLQTVSCHLFRKLQQNYRPRTKIRK